MKVQKKKTISDRQKLLVLLSEAKARGIEVPNIEEKLKSVKKEKNNWPLDSNGYFPSIDGRQYKPNEVQKAFIEDTSRFCGLISSRGGGKTAAGAQKTMHHVKRGESGAVFNPDFENFRTSTWPELRNWIPWNMVVPSQRHRRNSDWEAHKPFVMVFLNGAKLYCKGLKSADAARGPNLHFLWYDEAGRDMTGESWQVANAAVRLGKNPQSWVTATPKGKNHWMYKLFVEKDIPQDALDAYAELGMDRELVSYYHTTIEENKVNLSPDFYATMLANYPAGYLREQEIYGNFADEGGKIGYSEWFKDKVIDNYKEDWEVAKTVRYWDMAATEKKLRNDPDEAVGTRVTKMKGKDPDFVIDEQVAVRFDWSKLKPLIADTARRDGPFVTVVIEEEPGSGGKNQVAEIQEYFKSFPELASHKVIGQRPSDRALEANYWFGLAARGKVWLMRGDWKKLLEQVDGFLQMEHDDRVTSPSGAFKALSPFKSWKRIEFVSITGG